MGFRRVITGHSSDGASVVLADESVSSIDLGAGSLIDLMWALDGEARVPNDGVIADIQQWFPDIGGIRVFTWVKNPQVTGHAQTTQVDAAETTDLGLESSYEAEHPGMHTSQTIDVNVVLSGEIWLELDNGLATRLAEGDVVIQNGTRHKWENRTDEPTTMLSVTVGARHAATEE